MDSIKLWARNGEAVRQAIALDERNYPGRLRAPMPSAFTAFLGKG
jgi:hypothetical protein